MEKYCVKFENHIAKFNIMKSTILFSGIFLGILMSCTKKETQYRRTSVQDTIITPDTRLKKDTLVVQDTVTPDTGVYQKDSVIHKK